MPLLTINYLNLAVYIKLIMKLRTLLPTITGSLLGLLPLNLEAQQTLYKKEHKPSKTTVEISGSKELSDKLEYEILIKSNNFSPEERLIRPQISDAVVVLAVPEEMNIDYNSIKTERWDFKSKNFVEIKSDSKKVRDLETGLLENLIQTKLPFFSLGIKSFEEQKREDIADAQEKLPEWAKDPNKVDYLPIYINTTAGADAGKDVVKIRFSLNLEEKISNMELPAVITYNYYGPEMFENINPKVATHIIGNVNHYYKQFGNVEKSSDISKAENKETEKVIKDYDNLEEFIYWNLVKAEKQPKEGDLDKIKILIDTKKENAENIFKNKALNLEEKVSSLGNLFIDSERENFYMNYGTLVLNDEGRTSFEGLLIFKIQDEGYDLRGKIKDISSISIKAAPNPTFGWMTLEMKDGSKIDIDNPNAKYFRTSVKLGTYYIFREYREYSLKKELNSYLNSYTWSSHKIFKVALDPR